MSDEALHAVFADALKAAAKLVRRAKELAARQVRWLDGLLWC